MKRFRILVFLLLLTLAGCRPAQETGYKNSKVHIQKTPDHETSFANLFSEIPHLLEPQPPAPFPHQSDADLVAFATQVENGQPDVIVGLYSSGAFAFPVIQQPAGDDTYISDDENVITQYRLATSKAGSLGFLAHNFLAGSYFYRLDRGSSLQVIYGDRSYSTYVVEEIVDYQVVKGDEGENMYRNLATSEVLNASDLFMCTYIGENRLVLLTCIQNGNDPSWGRRFIIATQI